MVFRSGESRSSISPYDTIINDAPLEIQNGQNAKIRVDEDIQRALDQVADEIINKPTKG